MAKLEQKILELLKTRSPYQLGRKYARRMGHAGQVLSHPNFPKETKPGVFAGREKLKTDFATMIHKLGAAAKSRDAFSKEVARGETRGREQAAGISKKQSPAGGVPTPRKRGAERRKLTHFAKAIGFDKKTALHPLDPRSEKIKEALTGKGLEKYLKGAPTSKSGANRAAKNWNAMLKDFRAGKLPVGRKPLYPTIQRRLKQAEKISDHLIREFRRMLTPAAKKDLRFRRMIQVGKGRVQNVNYLMQKGGVPQKAPIEGVGTRKPSRAFGRVLSREIAKRPEVAKIFKRTARGSSKWLKRHNRAGLAGRAAQELVRGQGKDLPQRVGDRPESKKKIVDHIIREFKTARTKRGKWTGEKVYGGSKQGRAVEAGAKEGQQPYSTEKGVRRATARGGEASMRKVRRGVVTKALTGPKGTLP